MFFSREGASQAPTTPVSRVQPMIAFQCTIHGIFRVHAASQHSEIRILRPDAASENIYLFAVQHDCCASKECLVGLSQDQMHVVISN